MDLKHVKNPDPHLFRKKTIFPQKKVFMILKCKDERRMMKKIAQILSI